MLRSTLLAAAPIRRAAATLCSPLLGSILLALLVSACDSSAGKETTAEAPDRPILVASVAYQNVDQTRSLAATIRPRVESDLGFRASGKVAQRALWFRKSLDQRQTGPAQEAPHPEEAPTLDPAGFNSHVANGTGAAHRQRGEAPQLAEQF